MKIWEISFIDDEYDNLEPEVDWDYDDIMRFNGRSLSDEWKTLKIVKCYPKKNLPLNDAPGFMAGVMLVNTKTKCVIENLIRDSVEFLPTLYEGKSEYWLINILNVLDCINYPKSEMVLIPNMKKIMYFKKYSFIEEIVKNEDIFKIVEFPHSYIFVSDRFKEIIETNNITGFTFELVWDSEKE